MASLSIYLLEEGFYISGISDIGRDKMRKRKDKWLEQPAGPIDIHHKEPQRGVGGEKCKQGIRESLRAIEGEGVHRFGGGREGVEPLISGENKDKRYLKRGVLVC